MSKTRIFILNINMTEELKLYFQSWLSRRLEKSKITYTKYFGKFYICYKVILFLKIFVIKIDI